jgi:hypothetical protein
MKYFILGFITGVALGFIPLVGPSVGFEIHPEWHGAVAAPDRVEPSPNAELAKFFLPPLLVMNGVFRLDASGALKGAFTSKEKLVAASGSGEYLAEYEKVGRSVEFFNIRGERFWKIKSLEYPYLTHNAKLVLLLNGDQSKIRIFDFNGAEAGLKSISGRLCTAIAFSGESDCAAAGFMDGNYYLLGADGSLALRGAAPKGAMVKSLAVSPDGRYLAVHYGGAGGDFVRLCDAAEKSVDEMKLRTAYFTRMPLSVNNAGSVALIDRNRFVVTDDDCDIDLDMAVPEQRDGHAAIGYRGGLYAVAYSREKGGAQFFMVRKSGEVLFARTIDEEPFLDCALGERFILLRGAQSLYCYSYRDPASR